MEDSFLHSQRFLKHLLRPGLILDDVSEPDANGLFCLFWKQLCLAVLGLHCSVHWLSPVAASGAAFQLRCTGFSLWWLLLCGLSSCGTWALLPHSVWTLPRPGIEPMPLALAGGFFTAGPPWKSSSFPLIAKCGRQRKSVAIKELYKHTWWDMLWR